MNKIECIKKNESSKRVQDKPLNLQILMYEIRNV